jgi:Zn-dependent protease with chaperone function
MVLSTAQQATLQKIQAAANQALPRIEFLEGLANVHPILKERAKELRDRREYLAQLATAGLELNRQIGGT